MNRQIPLLDAIREHLQTNPLPLHVPGHKMGRGFPNELAVWLGQAVKLDLTELPGLDDLHQPEGAIQAAQQLAAQAFQSDETFFLVGGSTAGNMAMILTVCRPGDTIVIPRNAHKSVHNAVMLAGARPVYLYPDVDERFGIPTAVQPKEVRRVLEEYPEAVAVLITSPTYQGVCSDLAAIAEEVHRLSKLLLVDEAHGAHFSFHDQLPMSAIDSGADLAVQSTHKMLGSLTGSAMLHGKGGRYDRERLRMMLAMVQTSSPSYLMLLSLDAARFQFAHYGHDLLDRALRVVADSKNEMTEIAEIDLYQPASNHVIAGIDPFKWWIQVERLGITGYEAEGWLRKETGIFMEMADDRHLLAVFSYADTDKQLRRLINGVRLLSSHYSGALRESRTPESLSIHKIVKNFHLEQVRLPKDALHSSRQHVKLEVAGGQVAAEPVIPYPPGIPVILPGERYSTELVHYLQQLKRQGARFQGTTDPSLEYVQIIE